MVAGCKALPLPAMLAKTCCSYTVKLFCKLRLLCFVQEPQQSRKTFWEIHTHTIDPIGVGCELFLVQVAWSLSWCHMGHPTKPELKTNALKKLPRLWESLELSNRAWFRKKSNTQPYRKSQVRQFIGILKLINAKVGGVKESGTTSSWTVLSVEAEHNPSGFIFDDC